MLHPSIAAVEAVARGAHSPELIDEVGEAASEPIRAAAEEVLILLDLGAAPEKAFFQAQALYTLAKQCIGLADSGGRDTQDGCCISAVVAELVANSMGAFALSLSEADGSAIDLLERISMDVDLLAPQLFGGLSRLGSTSGQLEAGEARLLRALHGICVWTFAALGRAIGYDNVSGSVLWEWASCDAAWALLLAKGALTTTAGDLCEVQVATGDPHMDAVVVPADLGDLRLAALSAALGLSSTKVIFETTDDISGEAITIQMRSAELVLHRAEVAVGAASISGFLHALATASSQAGGGVGPYLVSFLVGVLQPELASEPEWAKSSEMMQATAQEARRAAAIFASRLEQHTPLVWRLLAATPAALGYVLPPGFLQDCANMAYLSSPSETDFQAFAAQGLACTTHAGTPIMKDPASLACFCVLAANSGVSPEEGYALTSAVNAAMSSDPEGMHAGISQRWEHWRGPPHATLLRRWKEFVNALAAAAGASAAAEPPSCPPPEEPPPRPPMPAELPPPPPSKGAVLGNLLRTAPEAYCCQLDKRLMMDPVRTPAGDVFDRSSIAAALASGGGVCPLTGQPLALEQCERLPALRKEIQVWVRQNRGAERAQPRLAAAAARGAG